MPFHGSSDIILNIIDFQSIYILYNIYIVYMIYMIY